MWSTGEKYGKMIKNKHVCTYIPGRHGRAYRCNKLLRSCKGPKRTKEHSTYRGKRDFIIYYFEVRLIKRGRKTKR